jgi:long-chain fatty acid transport protein
MHRHTSFFVRILVALVFVLPCASARAGGLQLLDRGARPLSRGGAFVAGADDPSALWYNPAGLADSGDQLLLDATLTIPFMRFKRQYDDGSEAPRVKMDPMYLPIPTVATSHTFGLEDVTFGLGLFAPNTLLVRWPKSVAANGVREPSPTRYSLLGIFGKGKGLTGSLLGNVALGLAYHGIKGLSIGADIQVVLGRLWTQNVVSACDRFTCAFPEDPEYDAYATIDLLTYALTGVFGIRYRVGEVFTLGASAMLPYEMRGTAKLDVKVPSHPLFDNAYLDGNEAELTGFKFPLIARVGAEVRPVPYLRLETAFVWEQWSKHKALVLEPQDVTMRNVRGITDYALDTVTVTRNMRDTWSVRGGYEIFVPDSWLLAPLRGLGLVMRGGLAYERNAFAAADMTPFTLDADKVLLSGGMGFQIAKRARMDSAIGYYWMKDLRVTNSQTEQLTSIRPSASEPSLVGNGTYEMSALYLGGGFSIDLN